MNLANMYYLRLSNLVVGDLFPRDLYLLDRLDGSIPNWRVVERVDLDADGVQLDFQDDSNIDMFDVVRLIVLTFPDKTLRTKPQTHGMTSAIISSLCDLLQQARYSGRVASPW